MKYSSGDQFIQLSYVANTINDNCKKVCKTISMHEGLRFFKCMVSVELTIKTSNENVII